MLWRCWQPYSACCRACVQVTKGILGTLGTLRHREIAAAGLHLTDNPKLDYAVTPEVEGLLWKVRLALQPAKDCRFLLNKVLVHRQVVGYPY